MVAGLRRREEPTGRRRTLEDVGLERLSRRQFLRVAFGAGAATALPSVVRPLLHAARAATIPTAEHFFFDRGPQPQPRSATCAAISARIVPSDTGPGAI